MKEERRTNPIWLTVYADFTTNLMLFFLLLFTYSRVSQSKQEELYREIKKSLSTKEERNAMLIEREASKKLEQLIKNQNLEEFAMVEIDERKIKIVLREAITFPLGKSKLKKQSYPILDEIVEILKDIPNPIVIEGHTDNLPLKDKSKYFSNWELSGARAISVLNYLVKKGISPSRISVIGYGETRPIFSNETVEGRALNRRVEISIIRF